MAARKKKKSAKTQKYVRRGPPLRLSVPAALNRIEKKLDELVANFAIASERANKEFLEIIAAMPEELKEQVRQVLVKAPEAAPAEPVQPEATPTTTPEPAPTAPSTEA